MARDKLACSLAGGQQTVAVRIGPQVINILMEDGASSYSFDRAGRLIGAFVAGKNYRRGLDNRVLVKWSGPGRQRERRWMDAGEAQGLLKSVYDFAGQVAQTDADPRLEVLSHWDGDALAADARRFAEIYRPVSILPPDQYLALVLQATEGCSYNSCTFCDFYRDRPFRVKSPSDFRDHVAAVREFFGPAIALRRSVFLADANALVAPMSRIRAWLEVLEACQGLPGGGLYSFIDAFGAERKSGQDWAELAARGLRRVYIGMESGDDELLRFLCKPGTVADVVPAVDRLKAAGVAVSLILMIGIGGQRYASQHTAATIAALNAMPLGARDIVYFSPFVDHAGSIYGRLAEDAAIRPLTGPEMAAQEAAIRAGFRARGSTRPQFSRYDIREFIY